VHVVKDNENFNAATTKGTLKFIKNEDEKVVFLLCHLLHSHRQAKEMCTSRTRTSNMQKSYFLSDFIDWDYLS
jgi:hypothetical protein